MKKAIGILLVFCLCIGLCACGMNEDNSSGETQGKSEREKVEWAVEIRRIAMEASDTKFGTTIGDNEIKSVSVSITNMEKLSDTEYIVNGRITKTDVYGTKWNNTFDCKVTSSDGEEWSAGSFQYKSDSWTRGQVNKNEKIICYTTYSCFLFFIKCV